MPLVYDSDVYPNAKIPILQPITIFFILSGCLFSFLYFDYFDAPLAAAVEPAAEDNPGRPPGRGAPRRAADGRCRATQQTARAASLPPAGAGESGQGSGGVFRGAAGEGVGNRRSGSKDRLSRTAEWFRRGAEVVFGWGRIGSVSARRSLCAIRGP